jgi:hypothetical protein
VRIPIAVSMTLGALTASALPAAPGLTVENGWLVHDGRAIWGWIQHNGWWRAGQRPNLCRRSVGDPLGDVRPNRTEDLDRLTDNMLRYGYPGFEHNYGLWYDRRRDAHDTTRRTDPNVVPPFLEQPWARSEEGMAADGLPKYDLSKYNEWYFERLERFAELCDEKGTVLFHKYHMQHALLETQCHYVDFPWRPGNCVQDTGMPEAIPAANAFYDVSHPARRELHRAYIRRCLDSLGRHTNVVHMVGQEYTGPLSFVEFWMDTIVEWEKESGADVHIGLGAPKDVIDAVLADTTRAGAVDVLDLRCFWLSADGEVRGPRGGEQVPGRGIESGTKQAEESTPEMIYRKVREYRDRCPDKAIIDAIGATREQAWALLMAGGGLSVPSWLAYPDQADPPEYIKPDKVDVILPTYEFVREYLATGLPTMGPRDIVLDAPERNWCLGGEGGYLLYALRGGRFRVDLTEAKGPYRARWFDPRTGALTDDEPGRVEGGNIVPFTAPDGQDWALWLAPLDRY